MNQIQEKQMGLLAAMTQEGSTTTIDKLIEAGAVGFCGTHQMMIKTPEYIAVFLENPLGCKYELSGMYTASLPGEFEGYIDAYEAQKENS